MNVDKFVFYLLVVLMLIAVGLSLQPAEGIERYFAWGPIGLIGMFADQVVRAHQELAAYAAIEREYHGL